MKNILKKSLPFFILICSIFSLNTFVSAYQEPIYVKINGTPLIYKNAQPQITNQRSMVPIRETAEALGATIEWNKTTETMTILKGNRVAVHKMRSNVITVNGIAKSFDTPSINVKDRTLMPVLMLSEAVGNNVTWDNTTRTVNIISDFASIINVSPDKDTVESGQRVILTITASPSTEKVKIVDISDDSIISENTTYTVNSDNTRTFSVPWTPNVQKNTYKSLKIVGGTLKEYNEKETAYKVTPITIVTSTKGKIVEIISDKKEVARGDEIEIKVKADSSTQKVKIVDDSNKPLKEILNYKIENGLNVFETTITLDTRGEITLKFYAGNTAGYDTNFEPLKLSVGGIGSSSNSVKNLKLTFHDIFILNDRTYAGQNAELKISSSSDINRIEIFDENDKLVDKVIGPINKDDENNKYTWSLIVPIYKEGRNQYKIVGYNKDNQTVKETLSIVGTAFDPNSLYIVSASQRDYNAIIGDTVKFTVKTTYSAEKLKVMENDKELMTLTSYSSEGNYKVWEFRVKITDSNKDRLSVIAYQGNLTDSMKLSTYISNADKAKIYDLKVHTPEVYVREYIRITLYTNDTVSKVWVEDENGYKVSETKTSYDRRSGGEYEWDIKVPADKVGERVTFNVYAQDANGQKADDYFRVKINK